MLYRFIFRLVYHILFVIASIILSIIFVHIKSYSVLRTFLCMILYVFNVHTPIFPIPYIPLKWPPGEALEGPFLISVRLNSGPEASWSCFSRRNGHHLGHLISIRLILGQNCCDLVLFQYILLSMRLKRRSISSQDAELAVDEPWWASGCAVFNLNDIIYSAEGRNSGFWRQEWGLLGCF